MDYHSEHNDDAVELIELILARADAYAAHSRTITATIHDNILLAIADLCGISPGQLTITQVDMASDELLGISGTIDYDPRTTTSEFLQQFGQDDAAEITNKTHVERIIHLTVPINMAGSSREEVLAFMRQVPKRVYHTRGDEIEELPNAQVALDSAAPAQQEILHSPTQFNTSALTDAQRIALVAGIANTSGSAQ